MARSHSWLTRSVGCPPSSMPHRRPTDPRRRLSLNRHPVPSRPYRGRRQICTENLSAAVPSPGARCGRPEGDVHRREGHRARRSGLHRHSVPPWVWFVEDGRNWPAARRQNRGTERPPGDHRYRARSAHPAPQFLRLRENAFLPGARYGPILRSFRSLAAPRFGYYTAAGRLAISGACPAECAGQNVEATACAIRGRSRRRWNVRCARRGRLSPTPARPQSARPRSVWPQAGAVAGPGTIRSGQRDRARRRTR
jgi:hypothetical protein